MAILSEDFKNKLKTTTNKARKELKENPKEYALLGSGGALAIGGISMMPSAVSFARSGRALKKLTNSPTYSFSSWRSDSRTGDIVANYLEGGNRFGKSLPGKIHRSLLNKNKNISEKIEKGEANAIETVLNRGANKVGLGFEDEFSNLHYRSFIDKNPRKAFDFWLDVEAMGKSTGQFEQAIHKLPIKDLTVDKLDDLIVNNKISKDLLNNKIRVKTYNEAPKAEYKKVSLKQLHRKYKKDKSIRNSLKQGVKDSQYYENNSIYDAIKDVAISGTDTQKGAIGRMALDKSQLGLPGHYAKVVGGTSLGMTGIGGAVIYKGKKDLNNKK